MSNKTWTILLLTCAGMNFETVLISTFMGRPGHVLFNGLVGALCLWFGLARLNMMEKEIKEGVKDDIK